MSSTYRAHHPRRALSSSESLSSGLVIWGTGSGGRAMEASAGLVAGSHNRNELVVFCRDGEPGARPLKQQNRGACQICGDDVGLSPGGDPFVACNECAFPICRDCYEYERREGTQNCPQCKTCYKRLKGCARVPGDEEEDGADDLEDEFNWRDRDDSQYAAESMLHAHMTYGRGGDLDGVHQPFRPNPNVPLLTNGQMENDIYIYRVYPARGWQRRTPVLLFFLPDLQGRKHPVRECTSAGGGVRGASSSSSTPRWSRHASVQLSRPKSSSSYDDAVVFDLQGRVPAAGYASNQYDHSMVQSAFSDELPPLHQQQHHAGCCSIEFNGGDRDGCAT